MRLILLSSLLLASTGATAQGTTAPTFCERLAPKLAMKKKGDYWDVNALGGLKTALFGGSGMISFAVAPLGEPTVADYQRLQKVCAQDGKEIVCRVEEPLRLSAQLKNGVAQVESLPGEKAVVATKGTHVRCRDDA